ncbi:sigma-70 family RNA polymerase sigma factor [Plantactinospora sp. S1510]|uniref:Sigma-70 family RNA polymerase sigma factor n=1 Tax=Plantactinospora alkalitolerans TaxID=2789879 RepID=A0ABS0GVU3_9ACTN|nr:sigma-70 family RNA polymerase sigma factor [Plantactinospora alkalitolerans]MBF9130327.1 sigma-70 family RNA polymerase sigma factor [Plantactinospora alkalitolerans]
MRATRTNETSLVVAAQGGDRQALDDLIAAYLPTVYSIVRRALSGYPDVDDVVQETMFRALRELRTLRTPESFRPWLVAIALRQVGTQLQRRQLAAERAVPLDEVAAEPDADADFEDLTLLRLDLSDQRRQVVRASRWLDPEDRALLSLWWLEVAGRLNRAELAAALGVSVAHAGVRVQRMRNQLELSRTLVAALDAGPGCDRLAALLADWDGEPSPLWRKRITRHIRSCPVCPGHARSLVAPERLLVGLALIPVPAALVAAVTGKGAAVGSALGAASAAAVSGASGIGGSGVFGAGIKAGLLGQFGQVVGSHPVVAAVVAGTVIAGATVTTATWPEPAPRPPAGIAASSAPTVALLPSSAPPVPVPSRSAPGATTPIPRRPSPTGATPSSAEPRPFRLGSVSMEAVNQVGLFATTTTDGLGLLAPVGPDADGAARQRATFESVPGLADRNCISLRAEDGRYLRHSNWRLRLSEDEGTQLFRGDATFCVRAGTAPGSVSLESANYPGWYLRHRNFELWVDPLTDEPWFRADASFRTRPPQAG